MGFAYRAQDGPGSLSCSSTFLKHCRKAQEKRHAYRLGSNLKWFCTYFVSTFLTRWMEPRHATSVSIVSVESSSPPNLQALLYFGFKILSRSHKDCMHRWMSTILEWRHKPPHRSLIERDHRIALSDMRFFAKDEMPQLSGL